MDWNEMRAQWQRHAAPGDEPRLERPRETARIWRRVRWRDLLETGVAALLVPFFAGIAYWLASSGMRLAAAFALMLVLVLIYIPWRLWRSRRLIPEPDPEQPVRDFLRAERAAMIAQADMLRSVARWYYGPIAVGVIGFYTSIHGAALSSLIYAAVVLALCAAIEAGNRIAARKGFEPAIEQIDQQIRQLEENGNG